MNVNKSESAGSAGTRKAPALGRRKEPRLARHGDILRRKAQRKYNSLRQFYLKAEEECSKRSWKRSQAALKREFEKAFQGDGPFGWQLQELFEELVGIPENVKAAIRYRGEVSFPPTLHTDESVLQGGASGLMIGNPQHMEILCSTDRIRRTQLELVQEANGGLAATGSWSRDEQYLRAIEERLRRDNAFRYYRVLCGPPKTNALIDHLRRVVSIRDPDHHEGKRTLCIGVTDASSEPERLLASNEESVLIALPSVNRLGDYDTALLIRDANYAERFNAFVHAYFIQSERLITKEKVISYLKQFRPAK